MKVRFSIEADIDHGFIESEAGRRGVPFDQALREHVGALECTLHDTARWRHGITRVSSRAEVEYMPAPPASSPPDPDLRLRPS